MNVVLLVIALVIGVLIIGLLVFVHEAGHFFAAKFFKVKVEEFGFGFPPRIWGKKKGETIYSINAIPAGGFVRLFGEEGEELKDRRSFAAKGPWVRVAIIIAGITVNLLLAFLLFSFLLVANGFRSHQPLDISLTGESVDVSFPFGQQTNGVSIGFVDPGSPAAKGGLKSFDKIETADGQTFTSIESFQKFIKEHQGKEISLQVFNIIDWSNRALVLMPRKNPKANEGALG